MDVPTAPHAPYLALLDSQTEGSPEWRATRAGLATVRLIDEWIHAVADVSSGRGTAPAADHVAAAYAAIDAVEQGPLRSLLRGVVETTISHWGDRHDAVGTALLAYGRRLNNEAAWPLASDVYETFARYARAIGGDERLPDAHLRLGLTLRMQGRLYPALDAYARAGALATVVGNLRVVWLARVGTANVARNQGDSIVAAAALDAVIAEITPFVGSMPGADDVVARATHDRGVIAAESGQLEQAVVLFYRALERYTDAYRRERVLADLAIAFVNLGMLDAGRDALMIVSVTATTPSLRLLADANLMWVAVLTGQETVFERYRRSLAEVPLTGEIAALYEHSVGEARRRFRAAAPVPVASTWDGAAPSPSVAHVANAVREMRNVVCVG
jgi:tetratricopeptide (TPR) repeat protein